MVIANYQAYDGNKKLSYRKKTVQLLHNIEIMHTKAIYIADRPISIKSTDFQTRHNREVDVYRAGAYQ